MADAPRLLTPEDVETVERYLDEVAPETQYSSAALRNFIHTLRAAWGDKQFYQDGWVRADESLDAMRKERDAARAALREIWATICPARSYTEEQVAAIVCRALGAPAGQP